MTSVIRQVSAPMPIVTKRQSDIEAAFDGCSTTLYRYFAVRVGSDAHLADDLMQQVWVQAQRLKPAPPGEIEFQLRAIAKNLIRSHWRRTNRRPSHVSLPDPQCAADLARRLVSEALPAEELERKETRDQLLLALTELPSEQQDLLIAHYFDERSHAELAAAFGVSERAIEGRLYRTRAALRKKLEHLEPF